MKNVKIILPLIIITVLNIYSQKNPGKYFNNYFEFVKEIKIADNIKLKSVWIIDTFKDKILLIDKGRNIFLINENGKLIKKLNPEECHPGINWHPYAANFNKKGNICVMYASSPGGFFFGPNGECIGLADKSFLRSRWFAFNNDDQIIVMNTTSMNNRNSLILMDKKGKFIKEFGVFDDKFKYLISRSYSGGLVTDKDDNIYQLTTASYEVTKYDKSGKFIKILKCKPFRYIPREKDYSNTNDMEVMIKELKSMRDCTSPERLYLLSENILASEFWNNGVLELVLSDLDGNRINKNPINYETIKSLHAANGYLYFLKESESITEPVNPSIMVYKFKTEMRGK